MLEALKAERARRQRIKSDRFSKYSADPCGFVEMGLLGFVWTKQRLILNSVRDNRRTAVPSCHDVGKSFIAASAAGWWISSFPIGEAFVVTLAPTGHQVKAILWREIARAHRAGGLPGYVTQTEWKIPIEDNAELVGFGRSPKDTDPTALQGIHQRRVLVILDEACGIAKALWDAADTLCANEDSRMLAIGNPDDPATEFAEVCKPGSGWNVIPISAFESPNFTGEKVPDYLGPLLVSKTWVAEREKKWGKNSPLYKSKVLGQFPEQAKDGLISLADLSAAQKRELEPGLPDELGVDVARYGDNYTVIYRRQGPVASLKDRFQGRDTMFIVGRIIEVIRSARGTITKVKIDDTGVGGGVTDRLRELKNSTDDHDAEVKALLANVSVIGVNVGEAPTIEPPENEKTKKYTDTVRFANLKAQLNWGLRSLFRDGEISIPGEGDGADELLSQAGDIRYKVLSNGKIQMETKEEMVKRGKQSPDDWDALVLAFAESVIETGADLWSRFAKAPPITGLLR